MNSLNIVSRLAAPPPSPPMRCEGGSSDLTERGPEGDGNRVLEKALKDASEADRKPLIKTERNVDETTPLLAKEEQSTRMAQEPHSRLWGVPGRIAHAVVRGVRVIFTTVTAPVRYVIACFYDDEGHFSTIMPLRNFRNLFGRRRKRSNASSGDKESVNGVTSKSQVSKKSKSKGTSAMESNATSSSTVSTDVEAETDASVDSPAGRTRSRTSASPAHAQRDGSAGSGKRSVQIKVQQDEALRQRRAAKAQSKKEQSANPDDVAAVASALKSPFSSNPVSSNKMTKYPRAPAPPRPLVPRRQPSFTLQYPADPPKKTLIIDLDETLIHSMAKGGRMSTGHMVEVRLGGGPGVMPSSDAVGTGGTPTTLPLGSGVPILYYVHERPGCHEFLRKVSKWYNLVVFTASVQEYADPVIDWLERERRYFGARYYRQHCTLRNGAYIKDVAQVEPDLSRVMILDNSLMSYIFHEGEWSGPDDTVLIANFTLCAD